MSIQNMMTIKIAARVALVLGAASFAFARVAQAAPPALAHITVTNDLDLARPDTVIDLPLPEVLAHVPGVRPEQVAVRVAAGDGIPLVTQLIDESGGGAPDHLLILTGLAAKQAQKLEFFSVTTPLSFPARVYCRFAPERKDDFAWESDKIAYRMYGPALQATGEISSGVDVWSKRVPQLILNDWYRREAEAAKIGKEAVHTDVGTGLDCYKTGPARGCGGTAVWSGDRLFASKNFVSYKVLANGPIRVVFTLTYAPWEADGVTVSEVKRISLDAGSHFNLLESTFHFDGPAAITVAAGNMMHKGAVLHRPGDAGIISIWEPADLHAGMMATGAVLLPSSDAAQFKEAANHALFLFNAKSDQPISFYAGAGWSKSDVADQDHWDSMLQDLAVRLKSPVGVAWK